MCECINMKGVVHHDPRCSNAQALDWTKPLQTRDGVPVKFLGVVGNSNKPQARRHQVLIGGGEANAYVGYRRIDGKISDDPREHEGDVINVPNKTDELAQLKKDYEVVLEDRRLLQNTNFQQAETVHLLKAEIQGLRSRQGQLQALLAQKTATLHILQGKLENIRAAVTP